MVPANQPTCNASSSNKMHNESGPSEHYVVTTSAEAHSTSNFSQLQPCQVQVLNLGNDLESVVNSNEQKYILVPNTQQTFQLNGGSLQVVPTNIQLISLNDAPGTSYITLPNSPTISVNEQNQHPSTSSSVVSPPYVFTESKGIDLSNVVQLIATQPTPSTSFTPRSEEEPLYVNAKQYHRILKRRAARAKLESEGRIPKQRRKYLHESRHKHALTRVRGEGGKFDRGSRNSPIQETTQPQRLTEQVRTVFRPAYVDCGLPQTPSTKNPDPPNIDNR